MLAPALIDPSQRAPIRRATRDDCAALVELENSVFAIERMSARQWRRHLESPSAQILVATRERRLVGAAVLFFRRSHRIARLYSIAVAHDERGNGTGEALLETAERAARKRGSRSLRLEVRRDNVGAQRLYERHGYQRVGVRVGYYEDGHAAVRYEKVLRA
ncbi:MAG: ribosomal protein S18-alanine N-acetyltransferase [Dokdonella sp.]